MHKGIIFDIKKFAIHDGPGIRTTIFLKGCPLDCWWCHNPESKNPEIEYIKNDNSQPTKIGRKVTVNKIFKEVLKDNIFYEESKGGVTLSGGEPLMQPEFCSSLLQALKKHGIHTTIDTCGYASLESFNKIVPYTDLFLYDLKSLDKQIYKKYIGGELVLIQKNLDFLLQNNCNLEIRIPLIPGITDSEKNLIAIRNYLIGKNIAQATVLPYNHFVNDKLERFQYENKIDALNKQDKAELNRLQELINTADFELLINR
ncbi:MAG: glycyl-radical enzyme activating protein [Candidatus Marinimicrobia bacterium]|nr:glycyl-radical enzyme activating protein [Candidatus Neomarinimicrobiota bacterium]